MTRDLLLSIDQGTQSARALIFDLQGNLLVKQRVQIAPPYDAPQPGWAELNPEIYWHTICQACQGLWASTGVNRERIAAVTLTSQRSTVINLDREGKPLRPAILWLDERETRV